MTSYYPAPGSQGLYLNIWQNALPAISEILGSSDSSGSITLNSKDFALVGNRKSYSFNLEFDDGVVSNSIGGSTNTIQRVRGIQFDRFNGTLNLTIYVLECSN